MKTDLKPCPFLGRKMSLCEVCFEWHPEDQCCPPIWEAKILIRCSVCGNTTTLSVDAGFAMHDLNCGKCGNLGFEQLEWSEEYKDKYSTIHPKSDKNVTNKVAN